MTLPSGATIGPYTIVSKLGEGGMGEVYRATDTRLGRDVAVKVLPKDVAGDDDRRMRFEREAKALAAINHFNIAQVYGFEDGAIVMELLEGETLRDRLNAGTLPVRKAIDYGAQIARGLAAAHERGVIHRDLKPENIFIVTDGHAKILDFGLAREVEHDRSGQTMTREGTAPGVIMGTSGYMSPEQVRGAAVDSRSDVFALGVVLFEMLTGTRAFRRDSTAETMSAILSDDPAGVSSIRAEVSPAIDRIVQHCLEKRPSERFQSARDVAFALEALSGSSSSLKEPPVALVPKRHTERLLWASAVIALAGLAAWPWLGPSVEEQVSPSAVTRTVVPLPEGVRLSETVFPISRLALSPDGTHLAVTGRDQASGRQQIYLLPLDGSPIKALPGSQGAALSSWSTDSRHLLFTDTAHLMRASLDGGAPTPLFDAPLPSQRGPWNPDGNLLLAGVEVRSISAQGGTATVVRARQGERYASLYPLPGGQMFLAAVVVNEKEVSIRVLARNSEEEHEVLRAPDVHGFAYASGAVVFSRGGSVYGQRLDHSTFKLIGTPTLLAEGVASAPLRGAAVALSDNGILAYQTTGGRDRTQLTWVDRDGRQLSTVGEPADYSNLELSRDGRRLLVSATDNAVLTRDIYIVDVARGIPQRFTLDPSEERSAVWSSDDRRVLYTSKGLNFYTRPSDLSGQEREIFKDASSKDPYDWSPDGRFLLYRRSGGATGNDLWLMPLDGGSGRPVANSPASELAGNFSPDGRWIVYQSDESGQAEIYATRVEGGGKIQISASGGTFPRWRSDGREILYLAGNRTMMSVSILMSGGELRPDTPRRLFDINIGTSAGPIYDVTADGSRFIFAARSSSGAVPGVTLLQNWPQLLPRQSP